MRGPVRAVAAVVLLGAFGVPAVATPAPSAFRADGPGASDTRWVLEVRFAVGVRYRVNPIRWHCVENLQSADITTTQSPEAHDLGFDPTSGVFDGCLTSASRVTYLIEVDSPWKGHMELSYEESAAGGTWNTRCGRGTEDSVWCHKTGQTSLTVGKLN
jgi:hypothetical protein